MKFGAWHLRFEAVHVTGDTDVGYEFFGISVHRKNDTLSAKVCVTECGGTQKE